MDVAIHTDDERRGQVLFAGRHRGEPGGWVSFTFGPDVLAVHAGDLGQLAELFGEAARQCRELAEGADAPVPVMAGLSADPTNADEAARLIAALEAEAGRVETEASA